MAPWLRRRQIRGTEHLSQAKDEGILEDFLKLRAGRGVSERAPGMG
jgi:hypothetical protein